ncbi:MAG: sugar phosphate isomerase/epimerase family protein [Chthoniobacteraceae bacterium]
MRSAITVSLVPQAKGGPFVFWNGLVSAAFQASAFGFDALEIFPPNADALDVTAIRELLSTHQLAVAAVGTGGGWVVNKWTLTHADAGIREQARGFIRGIIEKAAALGAPAILGSMQGRWEGDVSREQAFAWMGEALEELGEFAASLGQHFLYEPLNRYETNLLHRTPEAAAWLRTLRTKNVRILSDLFHMNIEEPDIAAALREAGDLVGHVHFADSNRHAVGFGHIDVGTIAAALRDICYTGYLSAEILPLPDPLTAARQTIESYRRFSARARNGDGNLDF